MKGTDEGVEEEPYRVGQDFHTDQTEREMRGGTLEDAANERWLKIKTTR